ncbi:MAG: glycerophosphodiester phosphodiesterase family protein [Clostridia bacterium]|jgi:glycerophosphoryl diester phosphodiesterase|nr:glycerophosphodiester phosphodiesterase family protein [Clostridia bacterium]
MIEITAHRGAQELAPENTINAFKKAIDIGAHGIELDVQLTKDEEVVVIHDYRIDRTSNGLGRVSDYNLEEIRSMDFGGWYSEEYKGEKIPKFIEVINIIKNENIKLNVELKSNINDTANVLVNKVVEIIEENNILDNVIVTSFNHKELVEVKKLNSNIETGILYEGVLNNLIEYAKSIGATSIHPDYEYINKELIDLAHENDMKVRAWYIHGMTAQADLKKLIEYGIDGLIVNNPKMFLLDK